MKTIVNLKEKAPEPVFPALYINRDQVWLMTSHCCGTVVSKTGKLGYDVGYHDDCLTLKSHPQCWRRLDPNESVVLSND